MAKGYTQQFGIDYSDTYAGVLRYDTLRILFALASYRHQHVYQMDVKTAFLNGDLREELFLEPPVARTDGKVWLLRKAIYGLKQAGRSWYEKLDNFLTTTLKYVRCAADECLYYLMDCLIGIYVDDIIFAGSEAQYNSIKQKLSTAFDMTDIGIASWLLGIKVVQVENTFFLSQEAYINNMLDEYQLRECRSVKTPLEQSLRPATEEEQQQFIQLQMSFPKAIGKLIYLATTTRPDIAFCVSTLSQYAAAPGINHWKALMHLMRYLSGSKQHNLVINCPSLTLNVYSDADYAGDMSSRKSTSGYVCQLGNATVSWSSTKQARVALSTMEAEYYAMSNSLKQLIWFRRLLIEDLHLLSPTTATILHCDNQAAIALSNNNSSFENAKHIDTKHHAIRDYQRKGIVHVQYLQTTSMPADIMTKGLTAPKILRAKALLGIFDRGSVEPLSDP